MDKNYRVLVFGKTGCDKCKVLQGRLDGLLAAPEWNDFEKTYCDVETEDGLVEFCRTGCINPHRIPAFVVQRRDTQTGAFQYVMDPRPESLDKSRLNVYVGVQTDYSEAGRGVLTPQTITNTLTLARTATT
jgi:hypothetical protein